MYYESEFIELKSEYTDSIIKEIVAFLNTRGGTVFIGVSDEGKVVGVSNSKNIIEKISSKVNDEIFPNIGHLLSINVLKEMEKEVIKIEISEGVNKPYHIKGKGLKPKGVYIRLGNTTIEAEYNVIRDLIKINSNYIFEELKSYNQDLSFNYVKKLFEEHGIKFEKSNLKNIGILNKNDEYTNLGMLLSDQCEHTIKIAVFQDDTKLKFLAREEITGSVLEQIEYAIKYIKLNNKTASIYKGIYRIDVKQYDDIVLREALINAIVHRDYSFSGSIIINIYKTKIEFISMGSLVRELTLEDIMIGVSETRNKKLANIFYRLEIIESFGTGIRKIIESYEKDYLKPKFQITPSAFSLTLFSRELDKKREKMLLMEEDEKYVEDEVKNKIYEFISQKEMVSSREIQETLNIKKTTCNVNIKLLLDSNKIIKLGNAKNTLYKANEI